MNRKIKSTIAVFMAVIMLVTALTFTATSSVSAAEPGDTVYKNGVVEYIISPTNTTSIAGYEINMSYNNTIASAVDVQNMVELPGGEFMFSNKDIYGNYKRTVFAFDTGYYGIPLEAGQGIVKVVFEINDTTNIGDIVISDTSEFYNGAFVTLDYGTGDLVSSFNIISYGDVPESETQPTTEPGTEPTTEPGTEPTTEPGTEPTTEPTEPTTVEPATVEPTTVEPTTVEPTTVEPTTVEPTTVEPTTVAPTTMEPESRPDPGVKIGDVNDDGIVNGADAGLLSRYASSWSGYKDKIKNRAAADINNDGSVNGADAGILARYVSSWTNYARYFN